MSAKNDMTALLKFTLSATFHYSGSLLSTQVSADLFRLNPKATVQLQVQPYRFVRYYEMHISRYSNNTNIQISIGKPIFSCRHPGMLSPHRTSLTDVLAVAMRGRCNGIERRAGLLLCWRWLCRRRSSAFSFWFRRAFSRVGLRHEHTHSNSQAQGSSEIDCGTTPRNAGVITSGDEWHGD